MALSRPHRRAGFTCLSTACSNSQDQLDRLQQKLGLGFRLLSGTCTPDLFGEGAPPGISYVARTGSAILDRRLVQV